MPLEGNASMLAGMCEGGCVNIPFNRTRGISMKVISVRESIELCTESGWSAYDLILDGKVDKGKIEELGTLGTGNLGKIKTVCVGFAHMTGR